MSDHESESDSLSADSCDTTTDARRSLGVLFHVFLGYWRTDCALNVMATNSEQLSRGFVIDTNQEVHNTE
ncbi:hypothetical protein QQF64_032980 [Cirrhinus molitorella]|uniref:Uncharacterized protein n=1 Tax=Cirrhinus molitorella TaxID=172907 RepID=A0ABR3MSI4_9TELE